MLRKARLRLHEHGAFSLGSEVDGKKTPTGPPLGVTGQIFIPDVSSCARSAGSLWHPRPPLPGRCPSGSPAALADTARLCAPALVAGYTTARECFGFILLGLIWVSTGFSHFISPTVTPWLVWGGGVASGSCTLRLPDTRSPKLGFVPQVTSP